MTQRRPLTISGSSTPGRLLLSKGLFVGFLKYPRLSKSTMFRWGYITSKVWATFWENRKYRRELMLGTGHNQVEQKLTNRLEEKSGGGQEVI